jgi:hypothetical protein
VELTEHKYNNIQSCIGMVFGSSTVACCRELDIGRIKGAIKFVGVKKR